LLWISSSFPIALSPDTSLPDAFAGLRSYQDQLAELGTELAVSKIAIYPMDPAGLETQSLYQASSRPRGPMTGQRAGAQLAREDQSRSNSQTTMDVLAEETGGIVCVNNNSLGDCVRKAMNDGSSFYEIAYYPDSGNWNGEFHKITIKTNKSGLHLAYRHGYYAQSQPADAKAADRQLQDAACRDLLNSTTLVMAAKQYPSDEPGKARYYIGIDPSALTFTSQSDGTHQLVLKVGACTFDKSGKPLQFMEETINPRLTDKQYSTVEGNGYPHNNLLSPGPGVATVRLLVEDVPSGQMGSVNIPYTDMVASAATPRAPSTAPAAPATH
jgi:hypothetical protein